MKINWTSKQVSKTDWKNYYSEISSYTFLKDTGSGILIGFITVGDIPSNCEEITDVELLRIIDCHRRQASLYPFPLVDA